MEMREVTIILNKSAEGVEGELMADLAAVCVCVCVCVCVSGCVCVLVGVSLRVVAL